ncbi:helix-turn-helix domain-containing protein [Tabrizicola sp.]|uniref:helix-turn-helix domain-containing protein n=1 Tax=Tabrizicola sp. TaxID=2005166 RepID=UPI003F329041
MTTDVKPIRSEADYDAAMEAVAALWGAASGTPDGDRLDVLATLIDAYEAKHHAMDAPDPIEAIKFRMEQQGLTRKDLEDIIGTRTRIAEVFNRKRGLSIDMIRRLHDRLGISAEVLIRPSRKDAA